MNADAGSTSAELLAKVKLFAHLDRVALARLAGHVEPLTVDDGIAVCREGDRMDSIYVVSRGTFRVFTSSRDGLTEVLVETLSPGDYFGEMALLDAETRAPTVRAEGTGEVLRLQRARVMDLFRLDPATQRLVSAILGRLLNSVEHVSQTVRTAAAGPQTAQGPSESSEREDVQSRVARALVMMEVGRLAADRLRRVLQASVLEEVSPPALRVLFGEEAEEVARDLADLGVRGGRRSTATLQSLRERFDQEVGRDQVQAFARDTAGRLADAQRWDNAMAVLARHGLRAQLVQVLGQALRASPPLPSERVTHWLELLADEEVSQDGAALFAKVALLETRGDADGALRLVRRALASGLAAKEPTAGPRLTAELTRLAGRGAASASRSARAGRAGGNESSRSARGALVASGLAVALLVLVVAVPDAHLRFFLLFAAAVVLLISEVLPDFAVGLLLMVAWVVSGIATPNQALAGFASMEWMFVIAILGMAAAIARSGLLFRVGLLLVRRMPSALVWQAATLLFTGVILAPLLPQPQGRAVVSASLALTLAESLRLKDREPAAAVLGLAAWIGGAPMAFVFLNGAPFCLLAWGLLPPESRVEFDWLKWFIAAAPLGVFVSVGALASLFLVFRPHTGSAPSRERVNLQLAVLGPLSKRETTMIMVLLLTVAGWVAEPLTGIHPGIVAVLALLAAVVTGVFDRRALQELDWNYLMFYAVTLGLSGLMVALGVDQLAARAVGTALLGMKLSAFFVIPVVAVLGILVRLVLPLVPALLVLSFAVIPLAPVVGVHPWVMLMPILATSSMWILPLQAPVYLIAYSASEGRLFSHAQARRAAFAYFVVVLVGLLFAIPYWRFLGLL